MEPDRGGLNNACSHRGEAPSIQPERSEDDRDVSYFWKPREEKARPYPVYILGNIKLDLSWSILFRIILCRERTCCLRTGGKETSKAKVSRQRAPLKGIEGGGS